MARPTAEADFIPEILRKAGACALKYFDAGLAVELKGDGSPVTIADKEVEDLIRSGIQKEFPGDGILGEEHEELSCDSHSQRKWIVDPIDGTMNFSRGIPLFSILMALEEAGEIVAGGIYNPVWNDLFLAFKGSGAFKNGEPLQVSSRKELKESLISFGGPDRLAACGLWPKIEKVVRSSYRQRGYGDYLGFAYVFEGRAEANIEVGLKPWDLAPMKILVEESGGEFIDFDGGRSIYQGSCIVANREIGKELAAILWN